VGKPHCHCTFEEGDSECLAHPRCANCGAPVDVEVFTAIALADSAREREALLDKVLEIVSYVSGSMSGDMVKDVIARRVRELKVKP